MCANGQQPSCSAASGSSGSVCPAGVTAYCPPSTATQCPSDPDLTCFRNPPAPPGSPTDECIQWSLADPSQSASQGASGGSTGVDFSASTPQCIANLIPGCLTSATSQTSAFYASNPGGDPYVFSHTFRTCMLTGLHADPNIDSSFYGNFHLLQVFANGQCNIDSSNLAPPSFCNNLTVSQIVSYGSPISLIWEPGYDVDSEATVVRFPVDPNEPGQFNTWKASDKAPLLVYDAEHRGQITSAYQLFGDWTFGGRRMASMKNSAATKWSSGYQALASLDANNDGEISGAELAPLALWFDRNRDGISQPGEVVPVAEAGITRIFYRADGKDELTRTVFASKGFERVENGVTIRGASADWYSGIGAIEALAGINSGKRPPADPTAVAQGTTPGSDFAKEAGAVNGVWKWTVEAKSPAWKLPSFKPKGTMVIMADSTGTVNIVSMIFGRLTKYKGRGVAFRAYESGGRLTRETEGNIIITLQSSDESDPHVRLKSQLLFDPDRMTISGHTDARTTTSAGKPSTISYNWSASKS